ncbi:hypothetical protein CRYUN_Cryun01aG0199800 [Craigia yunnanensis]
MKRKHMEGKTKETPAVDDNDDDEEEEKINTFFTLVRNIRDAHNQMLIGSQDTKEEKEKAKEKEIKSTWIPSFKWEDFADDAHLRNNIVTFPSSSKIEEQKSKTEEHQELDLNLSL